MLRVLVVEPFFSTSHGGAAATSIQAGEQPPAVESFDADVRRRRRRRIRGVVGAGLLVAAATVVRLLVAADGPGRDVPDGPSPTAADIGRLCDLVTPTRHSPAPRNAEAYLCSKQTREQAGGGLRQVWVIQKATGDAGRLLAELDPATPITSRTDLGPCPAMAVEPSEVIDVVDPIGGEVVSRALGPFGPCGLHKLTPEAFRAADFRDVVVVPISRDAVR